ncbi:hypothetical protein O6H91_Y509900 [Diphasiastrum complanatum]|nr:hypothetical protein O6H91_Y509900 [Diphasiastrum complanatum]
MSAQFTIKNVDLLIFNLHLFFFLLLNIFYDSEAVPSTFEAASSSGTKSEKSKIVDIDTFFIDTSVNLDDCSDFDPVQNRASFIGSRTPTTLSPSDKSLITLPTYNIDNNSFLTISDISDLFYFTEAETLCILSKKLDEFSDIIDFDVDDLLFGVDDVHNDKFYLEKDCLKMIVEEMCNKEDDLPSEEEVFRIQSQLGFPQSIVYSRTILSSKGGHNINRETIIREDKAECLSFCILSCTSRFVMSDYILELTLFFIISENNLPLIISQFVEEGRDLLLENFSRDHALGHYWKFFKNNVISVAHSKFHQHGETMIMAIKALSHFLGRYNFNKVHRIIFVKKTIALKILGYGPVNSMLRSSHFALYATYVDLSKHENYELLDPYERRKVLHDSKLQLSLEKVSEAE